MLAVPFRLKDLPSSECCLAHSGLFPAYAERTHWTYIGKHLCREYHGHTRSSQLSALRHVSRLVCFERACSGQSLVIEAQRLESRSTARAEPRSPMPLGNSRLLTSRFLSREEQHALRDAALPVRTVGAGTDLVRKGEYTDSLFIIDGWACRYTNAQKGDCPLPALLVPGDLGNLQSLLFDPLDYGVRTLTEARVVALPRDRALALTTKHSGIARTFSWLALIENTTLSKWASLSRRSSKERFAHLLCELSIRLDAQHGNESSFMFPLTQGMIAEALGLTSVLVNYIMQQLRAEGLIMIGNRTMTLPDVAQLRWVSEFDSSYLQISPRPDTRLAQGER